MKEPFKELIRPAMYLEEERIDRRVENKRARLDWSVKASRERLWFSLLIVCQAIVY